MSLEKIYQSKWFRYCGVFLIIFVILLIVFQLGMFVGYKKATFSFRWGENYYQNFAGERRGGMMGGPERGFLSGHGIGGSVIKVDAATSTISIKGKNGTEEIILVNEKTEIRKLRDKITLNDLKTDDNLIVLGSPNDKGQIVAQLIRVAPLSNEQLQGRALPPAPPIANEVK